MEMMTSVNFRGAVAHFKIKRESPGIYLAHLIKYEGPKDQSPPGKITLMRGIRQWTGSYEDEFLLLKLGKAVEDALKDASDNDDAAKTNASIK